MTEHLELDAVELVEAGPRAGRGLEELGHGQVVQAVRAVEHHALDGHGLAQVLGRLRLARAGRALGRAAEVEVHCAHHACGSSGR